MTDDRRETAPDRLEDADVPEFETGTGTGGGGPALFPAPSDGATIGDDANVSGSPAKDPEDWVTGREPMTGPQASYLQTLSREAGVPFDDHLTKAEASQRIDELQAKTGRGQGT